jgi:hypothetical protein
MEVDSSSTLRSNWARFLFVQAGTSLRMVSEREDCASSRILVVPEIVVVDSPTDVFLPC